MYQRRVSTNELCFLSPPAAVVIQFKQHIFSHRAELLENFRKYHVCPKPRPKEVIVYFSLFFHFTDTFLISKDKAMSGTAKKPTNYC